MRVWIILKNNDQNEGRGPLVSTGIAFDAQGNAIKFVNGDYYAKHFGVQGTAGSEHCVECVEAYGSIAEFKEKDADAKRDALRKVAISKLTKDELDALLDD